MKLKRILFFTFLFTVLIFCVSCGGKNKKYPDIDDDIFSDDDTDTTDTAPIEEDGDHQEDITDNDADTDTEEPGDDDTVPDESPEHDYDQPDDSDSDTNPVVDDDTDTDTNPTVDDDTDTEETGDEDYIPYKDDPTLVCTGQNKCFNNSDVMSKCPASPNSSFFGQDAQYAKKGYCLLKSYSTTSDLVTDNIFGLIWQRNLPSTYTGCIGSSGSACTYQQAIDYCDNLNYAGFSDWRLPAPEEFATIINFGKNAPAIDTDIFPVPGTTQKIFWTYTASSYSNGKSWSVDFTKGETREENASSNYFYARCVRGGENLIAPKFEKLENSIVEDLSYDFLWSEPTTATMTWQEALAYCTKLDFAGETGWRLPNINELVTLLNHFIARPASEFPDMPLNYFWSSTSYEGYAYNAWIINTSDGTIKAMDKTLEAKVLCVK